MKILYIGEYRNQSQFGEAARNYIRAMASVGLDVVPRPLINPSRPIVQLESDLIELEAKSERRCDVVIQHCKPQYFDFNGRFRKNIGITAFPSKPHINNFLLSQCMQMDLIYSTGPLEDLDDWGLIPHCIQIPTVKPANRINLGEGFNFCFAGKMNKRKNITALLQAFHGEFDRSENVNLVIKTNVPGLDSVTAKNEVTNLLNKIKEGLGLYKSVSDYKQEIVITDFLTEEGMWSLHNSHDSLVLPSYGESWNYHALKSLVMGKSVISNTSQQIIKGCLFCNSIEESVMGTNSSSDDVFDGRDTWYSIDISDLRLAMREEFTRFNGPFNEDDSNQDFISEYNNYSAVGQLLGEICG